MNGKLIFAEIPKLPNKWFENLESVWTVWKKTDYYLWGANKTNMFEAECNDLNGGGLASPSGPTRGKAHDHYIGINTMEEQFSSDNHAAFANLTSLIKNGNNVIIPIFNEKHLTPTTYKYSLGTGYGSSVYKWYDIQKDIFKLIIALSKSASSVDIPKGVYWPDCQKPEPYPEHTISSIDDIIALEGSIKTS